MVGNALDEPSQAELTVIPVPGELPEGLALSPNRQELWTATRNDGNVSIIDISSQRVVETLTLGMKDANRLKFTPDNKVLVIDGEAASLVVLDAASRTELKRITLDNKDTGDGAILVAPDGSQAYLGLRDADRVAVLDLNTLEITHEISMGDDSGPCLLYTSPSPRD